MQFDLRSGYNVSTSSSDNIITSDGLLGYSLIESSAGAKTTVEIEKTSSGRSVVISSIISRYSSSNGLNSIKTFISNDNYQTGERITPNTHQLESITLSYHNSYWKSSSASYKTSFISNSYSNSHTYSPQLHPSYTTYITTDDLSKSINSYGYSTKSHTSHKSHSHLLISIPYSSSKSHKTSFKSTRSSSTTSSSKSTSSLYSSSTSSIATTVPYNPGQPLFPNCTVSSPNCSPQAQPPPHEQETPPAPTIVASVIGSVAGLALIIVTILYIIVRKKNLKGGRGEGRSSSPSSSRNNLGYLTTILSFISPIKHTLNHPTLRRQELVAEEYISNPFIPPNREFSHQRRHKNQASLSTSLTTESSRRRYLTNSSTIEETTISAISPIPPQIFQPYDPALAQYLEEAKPISRSRFTETGSL